MASAVTQAETCSGRDVLPYAFTWGGGGGAGAELAGCEGRVPPRSTEARNRALAPGGTAPGAVGLWPLAIN
jgi:hypothetical protein